MAVQTIKLARVPAGWEIDFTHNPQVGFGGTLLHQLFIFSVKRLAGVKQAQHDVCLLERLADSIAQAILEDERIATVSITIRKSEMFPDCTPGVTITRTR